ncbi:hypothetical protein [Staphylococcus phage PT94]
MAMIDEYILNHPSYQYAIAVTQGDVIAGKYIKKECRRFLDELENEDSKYFLDVETMEMIDGLTQLINMADGHLANTPVKDALGGFQWYFIINSLCWKHKNNPEKRKYEKNVLLIARKSGKSMITALLFILLLLIEPRNSEFYSVAPDRELSSIVKKEIAKLIEASPHISEHFKIIKSEVTCLLNNSKMVALAFSENRLDGRKANVFVSDEVGAMKSRYPIDAMESSQMNMLNRTGVLISTAYQSTDNPMTQEVEYAEKVLDGIIEDESLFALLYKPDDSKEWMTDKALYEANPLCYDVPENYDYLVKKRSQALEMPSAKSNFLTKHLNIFVDGNIAEAFVNVDDLRQGLVNEFDWHGREVYLGLDLAETIDNTAVSMVAYEPSEEKFYVKSWSFIPEDNATEKSKRERIDYFRMKDKGWAFFCGDRVINQRTVEDFVLSIEDKYGVKVKGLGYDRRNAISSVNRFVEEGNIECIEVRQHTSALGPTFKLMRDKIIDGDFHYEPNDLLENNFKNARTIYNNNMDIYVNKKKSAGKIDMVYSTADALYLWKQDIDEGLVSTYEDRGLFIL